MVTETQVPNKNKEYAAFSPVIEPLFCGTGLKYQEVPSIRQLQMEIQKYNRLLFAPVLATEYQPETTWLLPRCRGT